MKKINWKTTAFLGLGLVCAGVRAENPDPRLAKLTYDGTGTSEKSPEIGEVFFTFSVDCQASAEDVSKAIEAVSGKIWKAISTKVPATHADELQRAHWGNIGNIAELEGAKLVTLNPGVEHTPPAKPVVKRINKCTGKEISFQEKVGTVFSGSQKIGVRTTDLDWVEGLTRTVGALPQDPSPHAVKVNSTGVSYRVAEATQRKMLEETLEKARAEALGKGSKYESDKKNLKFASSHFLGHHAATPAPVNIDVGSPVARGKAPKVELALPITYSIYAEAKDLIDAKNSRVAGVRSDYEITGNAVADADYAAVATQVSATCQPSQAKALEAIQKVSDDVLKELRDYQGKTLVSETDRIENNESSAATQESPYKPVEWDAKKPGNVVSKYLNGCNNELVSAPASGDVSELPTYWTASRTLVLRSSQFDRLLGQAETLAKRYGTSKTRAEETRVRVSDAVAQLTEKSKGKLVLAARENATSFILNAHGPLAKDATAHGFTNAHLVNIRVGYPRPVQLKSFGSAPTGAAFAAPMSPSAESAPLVIETVKKPGEERPLFRTSRSYAFDVQVVTENYLPLLQEKKPAATEIPRLP